MKGNAYFVECQFKNSVRLTQLFQTWEDIKSITSRGRKGKFPSWLRIRFLFIFWQFSKVSKLFSNRSKIEHNSTGIANEKFPRAEKSCGAEFFSPVLSFLRMSQIPRRLSRLWIFLVHIPIQLNIYERSFILCLTFELYL